MGTETAILAGGCFWPAQELLRHRDGVISTEDQNYLQHYPEGSNQFSPVPTAGLFS